MKQTFNIPDGCKTVSVEQVGNQIITSFEPEKYVPKVGDLVKNISTKDSNIFAIFAFKEFSRHGKSINFGDYLTETELVKDDGEYCFNTEFSIFQKLTPEEFQAEFEKLGYVYDFETHTARKKRKRVEFGEFYYCADSNFEPHAWTEAGDDFDINLFEVGNYFETKDDCQTYCDYMKDCSLKYFDK